MNFIDRLTDFFLSTERRFSAKFLLFSVIILSVLGIDYLFRFSDFYIANSKIQQIEKIESILQKDTLRTEARKELVRIEQAAIDRQGFWDLVSVESLTSLIQRTISSQDAKTTTKINTRPIERNVWYHNISSGWIFWLIIAISPFILISDPSVRKNIVGLLFVDLFAAICAFILAYLFAFIPVLWYPVVNYTINAALCFGLIWVLAVLGTRASKKA